MNYMWQNQAEPSYSSIEIKQARRIRSLAKKNTKLVLRQASPRGPDGDGPLRSFAAAELLRADREDLRELLQHPPQPDVRARLHPRKSAPPFPKQEW